MGLRLETEKALRDVQKRKGQNTPGVEGTGALAVEDTTPGGPCENAGVKVGDVLVSVNDVFVTDFVRLESTLDDCVGKEVQLTLDRAGTEIKLSVIVQDLHLITPARFLECAGGIVHALSYQQARNFQLAAGSAYVAEPGYLFGLANVPKHAIIVALDNTKTPDLNAFAEAFNRLTRRVEAMSLNTHNGEQIKTSVKFFTRDERHRVKTSTFRAHFKWHPPPAFFDRDWRTGVWNKTLLSEEVFDALKSDKERREDDEDEDEKKAKTGEKREKRGDKKRPRDGADGDETVAEMTVDDVIDENSPDDKPSGPGPSSVSLAESVARALEPSLCVARCDIASVALADGVYSRSFEGNGLVLHHDPFGKRDRNCGGGPEHRPDKQLRRAVDLRGVPARDRRRGGVPAPHQELRARVLRRETNAL
jgi:hypothetical protein